MKYTMLLPLFLLAGLAYAMAAPQTASQQAENEVNKGIQAYKYYRYESAIEHFRQATKLDPQSRTATLCLATTLAQEYVPGVDTPDNLKWATEAIEIYKQMLAQEPKNLTVFKWLGYLEMGARRFEEAKSYYRQASQAQTEDADTFYTLGALDWTEAYKRRADERRKHGLSIDHPASITQPFCAKLRTDNLPLIEDGMQALKRAMELRADYDDAMAYMNLLYRERAEIECNNKATRASDLQQANEWTGKAMEIRKRNAEKYKESKSLTVDHSPLTDTPVQWAPPPPPPPPPPKRKE